MTNTLKMGILRTELVKYLMSKHIFRYYRDKALKTNSLTRFIETYNS